MLCRLDLWTLVLGLCRRFRSANGRPPHCLVGRAGHLQHQCLDSHPPHSACVPSQAELEGPVSVEPVLLGPAPGMKQGGWHLLSG